MKVIRGATKEDRLFIAQSLSRNKYIQANSNDRISMRLHLYRPPSTILLHFSQARGAEQWPCTHDLGFAIASLDHAATEEFISPMSNKPSWMTDNRTSIKPLAVGPFTSWLFRGTAPCWHQQSSTTTSTTNRLNCTRCSGVLSSNRCQAGLARC